VHCQLLDSIAAASGARSANNRHKVACVSRGKLDVTSFASTLVGFNARDPV